MIAGDRALVTQQARRVLPTRKKGPVLVPGGSIHLLDFEIAAGESGSDSPAAVAARAAFDEIPDHVWLASYLFSVEGRPPMESVRAIDRGLSMPIAIFAGRDLLKNRRAMYLAAAGRPLEAAAELKSEPQRRALLGLLPLHPAHPATLAAWREEMPSSGATARDVFLPGFLMSPPDTADALYARRYVAGLLAAQLGDTAGAESDAAVLESTPDDEQSALGRDLAATVRAFAALTAGDPARALRLVEGMSGGFPIRIDQDAILRFPIPLWIRAEALRLLGRGTEALRWYETLESIIPVPSTNSFAWRPATAQRRALIHEQLGERAKAAAQYRRFLTLWTDAEPAQKPLVEQARARLAALQ
jgi:tetratricopeptide (TPR) repeat protein